MTERIKISLEVHDLFFHVLTKHVECYRWLQPQHPGNTSRNGPNVATFEVPTWTDIQQRAQECKEQRSCGKKSHFQLYCTVWISTDHHQKPFNISENKHLFKPFPSIRIQSEASLFRAFQADYLFFIWKYFGFLRGNCSMLWRAVAWVCTVQHCCNNGNKWWLSQMLFPFPK